MSQTTPPGPEEPAEEETPELNWASTSPYKDQADQIEGVQHPDYPEYDK